ncbi:TorF family putative porin [Oryzibacter oryziterrae]|uniref:TorF family putative porin n=1 Tax=Oryzibacter oryziterrae TaxID=2766474 RepID=UPI001EFFEE52|nr:TorF family putative porin [Oryzibacter oryziterrae]
MNGSVLRVAVVLAAMVSGVWHAQAADQAADEAADAVQPDISWKFFAATDHYSSGLTATDHSGYAEGRVTVDFDIWRVAVGAWTHGQDHDPTMEILAGVSPTYGDWTFDASIARDYSPTDKYQNEWIVDANVTRSLTPELEANVGASYTVIDHDVDYADLYASLTYTFENGAAVTGSTDWEPNYVGNGDHYVESYVNASIPVSERFTLSGEFGYDWYSSHNPDPVSYFYWNAGVTVDVTEGLDLDLRYHGNSLTGSDCATQTSSDCGDRVMATLTYSGSTSLGK